MSILLEVAVDDPLGLRAALDGGADRIEMCSALALGGLTPSAGLMDMAARAARPVVAMIRPREGGFCYSAAEIAVMEHDIRAAGAAGLAGAVFGALTADRRLDPAANARLIAAARAAGIEPVLHRAFDLCVDLDTALEMAVELGFRRILTSGGAARAPQAVAVLERLRLRAGGRITIMPGSGIAPETIAAFAGLGFSEFHASCAGPVPAPPVEVEMGFASRTARRTDAARVAALKAALQVPH